MWTTLIEALGTIAVELIKRGEKPSVDDVAKLVKSMALDEAQLALLRDALDALPDAAQAVLDEFKALTPNLPINTVGDEQ